MLNSRRVLLVTMLMAGLMGATTLPAAAETTPSPTPTVSVTVPPKPSPTPTPKPSVSPAKKAARNIRINYVSKTVARLTWDAPADANGRTIHYYVRTTISLGGKSLAAQVTNDTTATSVTLRDVRPGSMLTPEVTTKYRKAQGRADRGSMYTQNQVVPGKPTAVVGKVKNGSATTKPSLNVTFKAPSTTGVNGTLIDSYRVRLYDAAGDKVSKTETLAAGDRSVTLTGLAYEKTYYVRVAAHNSAGYGTTGKSATVTTTAKPTPNPTGSPTPTATVTPTPTLTQLVTVPLPPVPQVTPTVIPTPKPTPTQTATPLPTASATPTPNVSSTPPGVFRNASDTRWFTISIAVAVGFGVLLSVGMFIFYRVRGRRGRRG